MGEEDRVKQVIFFQDLHLISEALKKCSISSFAGKQVPVKVHMGEIKNKYFLKPAVIKPIIDVLLTNNIEPFLFDSTVAYTALRNTKKGYLQVAKIHGFTQKKIGCPIVIDDVGVPVEINQHSYEVVDHLYQASHIIAISHVKGHIASGMGGAIKNFGMGGVTKKTKQWIHHGSRPEYTKEACTSCGACEQVCPFHAISITTKEWKHSLRKCFGCGVCVENCPENALGFSIQNFQRGLAEAAMACIQDKQVLYINVVKDIANSCDCDSFAGSILCPDIGYLVSDDPVAIDNASLDLIHEVKKDVFQREHHIDPYKQIHFGEEIGLGDSSYELITL